MLWLQRNSVKDFIANKVLLARFYAWESTVKAHAFRHTMASVLYFNGMDSISISKRLGHSKVSTTTDIYAHIMKQADEQAAECIANALLRPAHKQA